MIGRPILIEVEMDRGVPEPQLVVVEVHRSDFSCLASGEWREGDDEDLAREGVDPRGIVAVIRNRVRAFMDGGAQPRRPRVVADAHRPQVGLGRRHGRIAGLVVKDSIRTRRLVPIHAINFSAHLEPQSRNGVI